MSAVAARTARAPAVNAIASLPRLVMGWVASRSRKPKPDPTVTPAQAGVQETALGLDSRLRGNDGFCLPHDEILPHSAGVILTSPGSVQARKLGLYMSSTWLAGSR